MVFNAAKIVHTTPALSVTVSGAVATSAGTAPINGITYNQIKNSLAQQKYLINSIFIQTNSFSQFSQPINYTVFDSTGQSAATTIVTAVDPNQQIPTLNVPLDKQPIPIVFNGNSSISTMVLPSNLFQINFNATKTVAGNATLPVSNFDSRFDGFFDGMRQVNTLQSFEQEKQANELAARTDNNVDITANSALLVPSQNNTSKLLLGLFCFVGIAFLLTKKDANNG